MKGLKYLRIIVSVFSLFLIVVLFMKFYEKKDFIPETDTCGKVNEQKQSQDYEEKTTNPESLVYQEVSDYQENSAYQENSEYQENEEDQDSAVSTMDVTPEIGEYNMNEYFAQIKITDDIYNRIYKKSYKENCPLPLDDLRYLKLLYYGFDEEIHVGELIVNKTISNDVIGVFKELYEAKYPIEKMQLVDDFDADDNASMSANNTSAFNFRYIDGTTTYSNHGKGLAIDINPLYNPYVRTRNGIQEVLPVSGEEYADRSSENRYFIKKDDICYQIFIKYGFTWGGEWEKSKDYQHFEKKIK